VAGRRTHMWAVAAGCAALATVFGTSWVTTPASGSGRSCGIVEPHATLTHKKPPAVLLKHLGILRRDPRPADFGLGRERRAKLALRGINPRYVRRLRALSTGERIYLVPALHSAIPPSVPLRCVPKKDRAKAEREQRRERKVAAGPALCIITVQANGKGFGFGCGPARLYTGSVDGSGTSRKTEVQVGLVPDEVVSVDLSYSDGTTMTVAIVSNCWVVERPFPDEPGSDTFPTVVWRDAQGNVVKMRR
jgi:hypothetical protein